MLQGMLQIISVLDCEEVITFKTMQKLCTVESSKERLQCCSKKTAASRQENYKDTKVRPSTSCLTHNHLARNSDILSTHDTAELLRFVSL